MRCTGGNQRSLELGTTFQVREEAEDRSASPQRSPWRIEDQEDAHPTSDIPTCAEVDGNLTDRCNNFIRKAKRANDDTASLGEQMLERKPALLAEHGVPQESTWRARAAKKTSGHR